MRRLSRSSRAALSTAALLAVSLGAAACSTGSAADDAAAVPRRGGTVTYLLSGEVPSLDPVTFTVPSNPSFLAPRALAVYDTLAVDDPVSGALRMRLAQSMTPDPSGRVWTLRLRPGLRFSDGTPLDAAAVTFNWTRIGDPANHAAMAPYVRLMATADVVDPVTVRVTLTQPNVAFDRVMARYLGYLGSPTAIRAEASGFGSKPVGAGPYKVEQFVRDDHLTLVRNPYYSGTTYLDKIVIKPVVDETQRLNTLESGGADAMYSSDPASVEQAGATGSSTTTTTLNGGSDIVFNVTKAPFDDRRARAAIGLALDRDAMNAALYDGKGSPVDTLFAGGSPFHDASIVQPEPDRAGAQALLDQLAAAGKPLAVTFLVPQSFSARAEWFQTQLAGYRNISVRLQSVPDSQVPAIGAAGDFQAAFLTSSWLYPSPALSTFYGTGGTQNWGRYSSPVVDAALHKALVSKDPAVQRAAYGTVQRAIVTDIPSVFYARPTYFVIHGERVHGMTTVGDGSPLWTSVWVST